jgi:ATP phosphoribosyltransferase
MVPVSRFLSFGALLIANRTSWETKDLGQIVASLGDGVGGEVAPAEKCVLYSRLPEIDDDTLRLALPDGHQQPPTLELLSKAGIKIDDYPSPTGNRRPQVQLDGVVVKVIRPQDMPLQVANGNFDLAITGKDWLKEHLYQFPSSPVKELMDLKFGWVRLVAVVSPKLAVDDAPGLRRFCAGRAAPLRLASEYVNIADRYARDNRLGHYRVVPTWGATEAFLPDDADVLIENTQTGQTIARHNLKIIDTLFESTACLVGNTGLDFSSRRGKRARSVIDSLRRAVEG